MKNFIASIRYALRAWCAYQRLKELAGHYADAKRARCDPQYIAFVFTAYRKARVLFADAYPELYGKRVRPHSVYQHANWRYNPFR